MHCDGSVFLLDDNGNIMEENRQRAWDYLRSPACEGFETVDSGGDTIWGITERWHPAVLAQIKQYLATGEISMALAAAYECYISEYWIPVGSDTLPTPIDIYAFIQCVDQGVGTVKAWLRECNNDPTQFIGLCKEGYIKDAQNPALADDLPGWENRLTRLVAAFPLTT